MRKSLNYLWSASLLYHQTSPTLSTILQQQLQSLTDIDGGIATILPNKIKRHLCAHCSSLLVGDTTRTRLVGCRRQRKLQHKLRKRRRDLSSSTSNSTSSSTSSSPGGGSSTVPDNTAASSSLPSRPALVSRRQVSNHRSATYTTTRCSTCHHRTQHVSVPQRTRRKPGEQHAAASQSASQSVTPSSTATTSATHPNPGLAQATPTQASHQKAPVLTTHSHATHKHTPTVTAQSTPGSQQEDEASKSKKAQKRARQNARKAGLRGQLAMLEAAAKQSGKPDTPSGGSLQDFLTSL
ncbi:uncharacterized protein LOC135808802 [Sycon ciliatum]|uniref:uncharacterized protein LOC135808802 n=1 Tax=Sycon ciliatum TaxID=27933 RepID=UPI0031F5F663